MSVQIDGRSENSSMIDNCEYHRMGGRSARQGRGTVYLLRSSARATNHCNVGKVTIEILPEESLLEIFSFYVYGSYNNWETLVHVCRRWRSIVFAAPRRLDLELLCTSGTPAEDMLDIWPPLPIVVRVRDSDGINDNVLAALEERHRVCEVDVQVKYYDDINQLARAMRVTFPALTDLNIQSIHANSFSSTEFFREYTFLGGSAPNLRSLRLGCIEFPELALQNLLLSSPGLVDLTLINDIHHSGNHSSDEMVHCLSSLTQLEHLQIESLYSYRDRDTASRRPPTLTRTVFPVLSTLILKGATEYLDRLLAHIEAPHLNDARIEFLLESLDSCHLMCTSPFPALSNLTLSSPGLVKLALINIPCPEYISNAMVDCLSSLTRLKRLQIEIRSLHRRPDSASRRPPPLTRTVSPTLSTLLLNGETEFLYQLLAHIELIEAPHLNHVCIEFSDLPNFDISQISPCLGRTETFELFDQAWMYFRGFDLNVILSPRKGTTGSKTLILSLFWKHSRWILATLARRAPSPPSIFFKHECDLPDWTKRMGITPWLELLRVFTTVENLYLSTKLALCIAPALRELDAEGVTEVLPALQTIFIERRQASEAEAEIIQEVMGTFVAARGLSWLPGGSIEVAGLSEVDG